MIYRVGRKTATIPDDLYVHVGHDSNRAISQNRTIEIVRHDLPTEKVQCAADSFDLRHGPNSGERSVF
jgi:hypothetical protein